MQTFTKKFPSLVLAMPLLAGSAFAREPLPKRIAGFLADHCIDCHDESTSEGELNLDYPTIDWKSKGTLRVWEHVHQMVSKGIMPPADGIAPPDLQREQFLSWLDQELRSNSPIGGAPLRRLSRREYQRTIESLFYLDNFALPPGFPSDNRKDGFTNQSNSLVVAASHLEAFSETSTQVADLLFPIPAETIAPLTIDVAAKDLVVSYSSACLIDGAMRLASTGSVTRNATWPMRFEAPVCGDYEITVTASTTNPPDEQPELIVSTMSSNRQGVREAKRFKVPEGAPQKFSFTTQLDDGETVVMRYGNAPFDYEDQSKLTSFLEELFQENPRLAAAWEKLGTPARGGSGWQRLAETMQQDDLDLGIADPKSTEFAKLVKNAASNKVRTGETLVYRYFEQGPNVGIHHVRIHGPVKQYPGKLYRSALGRQKRLMGSHAGKSDEPSLSAFFNSFLKRAFRRPATADEVNTYVQLVQHELKRTGSIDQGMHLAIRTVLISPAFLYRSTEGGELTPHEHACRLSYFLTGGPPSEKLMRIAESGDLKRTALLREEVRRMVSLDFARDFTDEWLGLHLLENLMPDARLFSRFDPTYAATMRSEAVETFHHILSNNLPVRDFVDPDFVFTNAMVGWEIYGLRQFEPKKKNQRIKYSKKLQKVSIDRGGRRGGFLTMPAVMMATANGVDTQPVLRGVWMLNNILGSPPPEPPKAVPALTPDTSGASLPKQRLAAHMASENCAVCHREIDPLGFVLENFDPIGRWRDHYPKYELDETGKPKILDGLNVDSTGTLPDGTVLNDVTDLKNYLAENPTPVARCLSEKLMTYATGRSLNYREREMIAEIVEEHAQDNFKFFNLLVALIDSEVFRAK